MTFFIDQKYANLLKSQLKLFEWNDAKTASFRCPICGDSKKNKYKKRGYLYETKHGLSFKCQNCEASDSFGRFLKKLDLSLYKAYIFEKFQYNNEFRWAEKKTADKVEKLKEEFKQPEVKRNPLEYLVRVDTLTNDHPCKAYVLKRKIPREFWSKLYYTENYMQWVNNHASPDKFKGKKLPATDERLVIPFFRKDGRPYAYQGRYIGTNEKALRYVTIHEKDDTGLYYGLERIDMKKPVFVVEGPIDSMFLPNCLAAAGSGLKRLIYMNNDNMTFVFDNQPRNPDVVKLVERMIDLNKKIVIFPEYIEEKDINDMIINGLTQDQICDMLTQNTFQGLKAKLQFTQWKKV